MTQDKKNDWSFLHIHRPSTGRSGPLPNAVLQIASPAGTVRKILLTEYELAELSEQAAKNVKLFIKHEARQ